MAERRLVSDTLSSIRASRPVIRSATLGLRVIQKELHTRSGDTGETVQP